MYGKPCGPCPFGQRSAIYLQQACLDIAVFELLFSCLIFGSNVGFLYSTLMYHKDIPGTPNEKYWKGFSLAWQALCHMFFIFISVQLFYAHIKRSRMACFFWIIEAIILQLLSLGGLWVSFSSLPGYNVILLMTIIRIYFIWVICAYRDQIRRYPGGYPPVKSLPRRSQSIAPTTQSSIRYLGDG